MSLSKETFYDSDRHSTIPLPASYDFVRPSVNVGRRAKRKLATRRESCIPIGEARRCLRPRARDHLAAGVEKETREVTLRNGVRLPTALELIAKINIHYCNYFLRRGRAEGATVISESVKEREGQEERERETRRNEKERGEERRAHVFARRRRRLLCISVTRVSLTWSS